jgi:hypothetical protein
MLNNMESLVNDNYKMPKETYTDRLDENDIGDLLSDYVKVDNIMEVSVNTHIRYFTLITDKTKGTITRKFRMGGFLSNKNNGHVYIILSNGRKTWSVQTKNTVFYRKLTINEIKEEYEKDISEYKKINKKLLKQNRKYKELLTNNNINS